LPRRLLSLLTTLIFLANLPVSAQLAPPGDKPIRVARYPSISPDASRIAFTYQGNLWTAPANGGDASRLTVFTAYDSSAIWSPDGKTIAFDSNRSGTTQVYLMPASGGVPRQMTFHSNGANVGDWSPDGKTLLFTASRDGRATNIYTLDIATGRSRKIVNDETSTIEPRYSPDGKWIVFMRGSTDIYRKGYRGSGNWDVWAVRAEGGKLYRLTTWQGNDTWPMFGADGKTIYYVSDRGDKQYTLWRQSFNPSDPKPAGPAELIRNPPDAIWNPFISQDRKWIVFECDFHLCLVSTANNEAKPLSLYCRTDGKTDAIERAVITGGVGEYDLSPDGKRVAFSARGEIFTVNTEKGGDARRLTETPTRESDMDWSPDNKQIAFISNRDGSPNLYSMDVATRQVKRLTNHAERDFNPRWSPDGKMIVYQRQGGPSGSISLHVIAADGSVPEKTLVPGPAVSDPQWSPDSKWIAYVNEDSYLVDDIWVIPAAGGEPKNITQYPGSNIAPRWFPNGEKLAFLSDRTRNREREKYFEVGRFALYTLNLVPDKDKPNETEQEEEGIKEEPKKDDKKPVEVKIDFKEIELRARQLTGFDEGIGDCSMSPDGKTFIIGVRSLGQYDIWSVSSDGGSLTRLTTGLNSFSSIQWSPDSNRFYYLSGGGIRFLNRVGGGGGSVSFTARMEIDRLTENRVAFDEAWKYIRDGFYDPKFHGKDWKAIGDRYRLLVDFCTTKEDFRFLVNMMFGELNASHLGIGGGGNIAVRSAPGTAYLGVWYDESYAGPGVKITEVMPNSPADREESRLKPGEYILAVDGKEVTFGESFYETLNDKVGKRIALLVNDKPTKEGARTIRLRASGAGEWGNLSYERWVRQRREMTNRLSGGKVAYLHVQGMDDGSRFRFERELFSLTQGKEAVVLDVRFNGGGNTHDALLRILSRNRPYFTMKPRNGPGFMQPERAFVQPVTMLINERSFSDAEIFPNGFRALGLGKLVGVPTNGYVIFTSGAGLIDGSFIRMPFAGCYTLEGINLENYGVPPDIRVENSPEDYTAGRDPQLERAIEEALKEAKAKKR
jgi:Tol biopolymer transport system component/C-terminal processing protease CtpA/Prc